MEMALSTFAEQFQVGLLKKYHSVASMQTLQVNPELLCYSC